MRVEHVDRLGGPVVQSEGTAALPLGVRDREIARRVARKLAMTVRESADDSRGHYLLVEPERDVILESREQGEQLRRGASLDALAAVVPGVHRVLDVVLPLAD